MNSNRNVRQQDVVDRAARALREAPVPPGPSPEALAAVLAAGKDAKPKTFRTRILTMNRITKIAAAVLIFVGVTCAFIWLTAGQGGTTIAWADVQEKIRNARTVSFKATVRQEGMPGMDVKVMFMGSDLVRQELTIGSEKVVQIIDLLRGEMLVLDDKKETLRIDLSGLPEHVKQKGAHNFMAGIKKLIEQSETELGEKEINGRKAKGYRVESGKEVVTLWADAQTGEPIEMTMTMYLGTQQAVLSDFQFDRELDKDLFSMEVPAGYTEAGRTMRLTPATAKDLSEFLRMWAEARGGTFPDTLSELEWIRDCKDSLEKAEKELTKEQFVELLEPVGRARLFIQTRPGGQYHYAGKGVAAGDAETPIFWYKPEDSETYRVIYGDLSVKEAAEAPDSEEAKPVDP